MAPSERSAPTSPPRPPVPQVRQVAGHARAMLTGNTHMLSLLLLIKCLSSAINFLPSQQVEGAGRGESRLLTGFSTLSLLSPEIFNNTCV